MMASAVANVAGEFHIPGIGESNGLPADSSVDGAFMAESVGLSESVFHEACHSPRVQTTIVLDEGH